jgi:hypothetical protein
MIRGSSRWLQEDCSPLMARHSRDQTSICGWKRTAQMSIQRETLRLIQGDLKGARLCGDVLVVLPTEHFLRGFVFERTLEKEMYYLWRVIMPLYRPANTIILNYSTRISKGDKFRLTRPGLNQAAERIAAVMSPGHSNYLRKVRGPREFLKHVNWMAGNTMVNFRMDLALTHYMVGNVAECIEILESIPLESLPPKFRAYVVPFATELRQSPEDAASRVQSWERENIERLGLAEAVIGAAEVADMEPN